MDNKGLNTESRASYPEVSENNSGQAFTWVFMLVSFLGWLTEAYPLAVVCMMLFAALRFVQSLGKSIPIAELMVFLATAQWVLGPYFAYQLPVSYFKYEMAVESSVYFQLIFPPIYAFSVALIAFKPRSFSISFDHLLQKYQNKLAYVFVAVGALSALSFSYVPLALRFIMFLLNGLFFVGILIYFSNQENKYRKLSLVIGLVWLLVGATNSGVFHTLILWGTIFYCFYAIELSKKPLLKYLIIVLGVGGLFFLQQIKQEYRARSNKNNSGIGLLLTVAQEQFSSQNSFIPEDQELADLNVRLNQGWIISKIYYTVPYRVPFAEGKTIIEAIENALLPRILNPNKKKAGGQENFERFTGEYLRAGTSMGISILGEAYANYGKNAWLFMFAYGLIIRMIINQLLKRSQKNGIYYFLIPLIFLQVIKAETELYVVLNHLFKSLILVWVLSPLIKNLHQKYKLEAKMDTPTQG